ncbi:MAG: hypothetical protein BM557_05950 [Flavobacterium sp. MedPE-SWcel]|uniref:hypothetical protein n=1 Tax=uncultured Flavobacterium sp. TaxID=165435 RepID=UPI0009173101|nr:hypothetical protein [uncultured Flavobacterium sp.]OIQ20209.1 MAG: hypothetical protein BM557_05950 [Flavobacterium sp. MedPE-SWcel]
MKKILSLVLLLSVAIIHAQSTDDKINNILLQQASEMGKSFINGDYPTFAKFTHPTIVTMMGGEEKLIAEAARSFDLIKSEGVIFVSADYKNPSAIITHEDQLQCTLFQSIKMNAGGETVTADATLIAVSMDNGENWYFIDPTGNDITTMRKMIPTLSPSLKITK